jgi:uncharacterized repeat protein (TIGR01451 family)
MKSGFAHTLAVSRWTACVTGLVLVLASTTAAALGTPVGTVIENSATVTFDINGSSGVITTNTTTITVIERIDVVATLQSPQTIVAADDRDRALLFTVTNTGNGSETFSLAIENTVGGDDFDPIAAVPPIYFDTDGSGDLTPADQAYDPGVNDPVLAPDASVDVFLVNDIPVAVNNGETGRSQIRATSLTGTGPAGTIVSGGGDGGVDALIGTTTGEAAVFGEYIVSDTQVSVTKTQSVQDPFGGTEAVPGATITYTITLDVLGAGTATAAVVRDPIPTFTTYAINTITLNGTPLSDAIDGDAGELDSSGAPTIVVRLGDVTLADGTQSVEFQVTVD